MDTQSNAARYHWQVPDTADAPAHETAWDYPPVRVGFVGLGNMGRLTLKDMLKGTRAQVVALCDCDSEALAKAEALVAETSPDHTARSYSDFRELHRDNQVEAVIISTPDHWHVLNGIDAMRAGKDVYIEKPLSLTIAEGRDLCTVVEQTRRICQVGTQQRSSAEFRRAAELVRNGYLGAIQKVEVTIPPNNCTCEPSWEPMEVPATLDYDMWLGPAREAPYHEQRCHYCFRFISDYSGGQLTNWGAHHLDIVQWALGHDRAGPVRVTGHGSFPESGLFDVAQSLDVTWEYDDHISVRASMGLPPRILFIGEHGTLDVKRGAIESTPPEICQTPPAPSDIHLAKSDNHLENFLHSVRTRTAPVATAETGHRSATLCHMGNIAIKLGRTLNWNSQTEQFDDPEANTYLRRTVRSPWNQLLPDQ
jgi:predicted dehydrogenase